MVTKVQQATADAAGDPAAITLTGVTQGNLLTLVVPRYRSNISDTLGTPTDSSTETWSAASNPASAEFLPGNSMGISLWYLPNCAAGTHTVTLPSGFVTNVEMTLVEWSGIDAAPLDVVATPVSNLDTASISITSAATNFANELVIAAVVINNDTNPAGLTDPPTGYTSLHVQQNSANDVAHEIAYKIVSATGAQSASWSWTSAGTDMVGQAILATFKATAGAAAGAPPPFNPARRAMQLTNL